MKHIRKNRKDYSTTGFNNPEVQARIIAKRKEDKAKRDKLKEYNGL